MHRFSYPKQCRLLRGYQFKALSQKAFCFKGKVLLIFWKKTDRDYPRLGITVTKKFAHACGRNRFKRYVREAFRLSCSSCKSGIDMNVRPRASSEAPYDFNDVLSDLQAFFTSL